MESDIYDACESRGYQKLLDLTEVAYEVATNSTYMYDYSYFFNADYGDYRDHNNSAFPYIFPNRIEYSKFRDFLANSANIRNRTLFHVIQNGFFR